MAQTLTIVSVTPSEQDLQLIVSYTLSGSSGVTHTKKYPPGVTQAAITADLTGILSDINDLDTTATAYNTGLSGTLN